MLRKYYVNNSAQSNGDHEVHEEHCAFLKLAVDVKFLGLFENGIQAVAYAKKLYSRADGCFYCCKEAHNR